MRGGVEHSLLMLALGGLAAGLSGGLLAGAFGVGGGIVLVPLLGLLLGLPQHEAQGVTLAVLLLPVGLPAVLAYRREVPIRWRLVAMLVAGFLGGGGLGALVASQLPDRALRGLFVLFLVLVAVRAWSGAGGPRRAASAASARQAELHGLWIGALGGALSGALGIGGGLAMVPLLVAMVGLEQREAQATSLATMLPPVGLPGVLVYAGRQGGMPWGLVAAVVAGFLLGGLLSARVAARANPTALMRAFALFAASMAAVLGARLAAG